MVDATRVFEPGFQVTNSAGTPQSGAVLRFYTTTTAGATRTVYSDLGLSTSLGVTVTTNSAGRPAASGGSGAETLIYTGTTAYAVSAETSAGGALWSFNNVIGALDTSTFLTSAVTAETPVISKTSNYSVLTTDQGKIINGNSNGGTFTLTLPSAVTAGDGWRVTIRNVGTSNQVNVATVSAQTIDGQSSIALATYLEGVTLVSDGANWHISETANPPAVARMHALSGLGYPMIGGILTATASASALTIAVKTVAGADPTAYSPVKVFIRGQTAADEEYEAATLTAATSLVVSSGSTLGATSSVAFKLWVVGFNDGGTFRLGVINCLSGTSIYPLGRMPIVSSTAEGGAGAADSAHVFYTGTAVSSKPYTILGYLSFESGLGTAGTWSDTPTRFQIYGPGVPLPGSVVQTQRTDDGALATGTTLMPHDDTIPQNTEGTQFQSQAITPASAANLLRARSQALASYSSNSSFVTSALFRDSTANAVAANTQYPETNARTFMFNLEYNVVGNTTSATTFKVRIGSAGAGTMSFNGAGGARLFGGVANSFIAVEEIVT